MENNIVFQKKSIFDKIKDFALQNKDLVKTIVAVLMLIMALYHIRYAFSGISGLFQWGIAFTIATFLGMVSHALGFLGFGGAGLILLTKNKKELIKTVPYLIGGSYILYALSSVVWILFAGSFSLLVTGLINIAMGILWIWINAVLTGSKTAQDKDKMIKPMIVAPAAVFAVRIILSAVGAAYNLTFTNVILSLIETAILILFVLTQFAGRDEAPAKEEGKTVENYKAYNGNTMPEGYNEVWKVIVFSIITFGIYFCYWIYKTVGFLNRKTLENQSQGIQLVLCMFIPFYIIYWMHKESKLIEVYSERVGNKNNDLSVITLILAVFGFAIISAALMQDQINKNLLTESGISTDQYPYQDPAVKPSTEVPSQVVTEQATTGEYKAKPVETPKAQPAAGGLNGDDIEMLRKLKELLDEGVLTAEEFETAKKSVLNK